MKYRGLSLNKEKQAYEWVYGMPSYGFETEKITEIGTPDGSFYDILPTSLGEETNYKDKYKKQIYTGDIVTLKVGNETREFVVSRKTIDREYNTLLGFDGDTVKVRLSGVIVFCYTAPDGSKYDLLPCVSLDGRDDTYFMEIIDTVSERAIRESEGES